MPIFADAEQLQTEHPDTFHRPDDIALSAVSPGDLVKICAEGERFWVEVTHRDDITLRGRIRNNLVNTAEHGLRQDDDVNFEPRHIYAVE